MNRRLIKATVIFFLIMIFFTLLSRFFYNFTAAKVTIAEPEQMEIEQELYIDGKVVQEEQTVISVVPDQIVKAVYVEEGEQVSAGTVLFEVDTDELSRQIAYLEQEIYKLDLAIADARNAEEQQESNQNTAEQRAAEDLENAKSSGDAAVDKAYKELIEAQSKYDAYMQNPDSIPGVSEEELKADVDEKQQAYDDALALRDASVLEAERALEDAKNAAPTNSEVETMEIEKEQKVDERNKCDTLLKSGGQVVAPVDAIVAEVNIKVGDLTSKSAPIVLTNLSGDLKFKGQVDKSFEELLYKYNDISISGVDQNGDATGLDSLEIASITENPENSEVLDVTVDLPEGSFRYGSFATLTISSSPEEYLHCVPIEAIRQDGNGSYYVLYVEETRSIMGTEMIAKKMPVEILDKNESYAAIESPTLGDDSEIIITSNKIIEEGSRVTDWS